MIKNTYIEKYRPTIKIVKYTYMMMLLFTLISLAVYKDKTTPFNYELYRTSSEFDEKVREKFPLGTNAKETVTTLKASGAKCKTVDSGEAREYDKITSCKYRAIIFTFYAFEKYIIDIYESDNKIVKISATK
ncbi:MAG: hypothetical protein EOP34_06715 [Rickettsiales bacterium]|nr:MAG: hypothetical protein EOP34_06715 [Rickettsiales bacterium]